MLEPVECTAPHCRRVRPALCLLVLFLVLGGCSTEGGQTGDEGKSPGGGVPSPGGGAVHTSSAGAAQGVHRAVPALV